jgi:uncharacterized integral membrane protein
MWILSWLFVLGVVILFMFFGFMNSNKEVILDFFWWNIKTQLVLALFVAFLVGIVTWFPIATIQYFKSQAEARRLRRENGRLQKELTELRNLSIEEGEKK